MAQRLGAYAVVLLVVAGQFKAHPALAWIEWDLTLIAAGVVAVAVIVSRVALGGATRFVVLPLILWAALIPTIASYYPSPYGTTKVITLFTVTFALAFAPFYLLRTPLQRRSFLHGTVVAGFIAALDVLTGGATEELYGRVTAEGTDTIGTARMAMAGAIALAIFAMSRESRKVVRVSAIGGSALLAIVALMTGSRGPALAAALSIVLAVAFSPMFKKYRGRTLVGVGVLGVISVSVVAQEGNAGLSRIVSFLGGETDRSTNARTQLWEAALDGLSVGGHGWGSFAEIGGNNRYPHNLLLEVGFEAGLIAMVVVGIVLIAGLISSIRRATELTGVAFFALLAFSMFNAMVSSDINGSRLLIVVLFATWAITRRRALNLSPAVLLESAALPTPDLSRLRRPLRTR